MEKRKLNHYDVFEVIDTFDIEKNRNCTILKDWLNASSVLTEIGVAILKEARQQLELKWDEWNEEELKMNRIGGPIYQSYSICCSSQ